jgi:hypothetical protein
MADLLEYDGAEFQILETFQFEEEVARPENLRFFTLEEQLIDYFEARMPKGKPTRFQLKKLEIEQDRVRDAYLASVEDIGGDYTVKKRRIARMPPWIHPLADAVKLNEYSYMDVWAPLFKEDQRSIPGYYSRLLLALPAPYRTEPNTDNPAITVNTVARTENGSEIRGLGSFEKTKTVVHESGTMEIVGVASEDTRDDIRIRGYAMDARTVEIPNPLAGHPFLSSVEANTLITKESFTEVYPNVESILTHGVATTKYPFTEGMKYLKLYDVRLNEIPWSVWKQRFPPVEVVLEPPPPISVTFPAAQDTTAPSQTLQSLYGSEWKVGVHPRHWLMKQEDAGAMVSKILLSRANDAGLVEVKPIGEILNTQFSDSNSAECLQTGTFGEFIAGGVYRADKCIPVAAIHQERASLVSLGRKAWREDTGEEIKKTHQDKLLSHRYVAFPLEKFPAYASTPVRDIPELRLDMLLLLKDPERTDGDKLDSIETLLKDILPTNKVFLDADGSFLMCQHTLAKLRGDMASDLQKYYRDWTATDLGYQVCKSCGERVGQVYAVQDEFDETGRLIVSRASLTDASFHGQSQIDSFSNSIKKLQGSFQLKNALDSVFYLILSLLQVLPEERQLIPILHVVRRMSSSFRELSKTKKFTEDVQNRVDGTLGFVGALVLLQTHSPFLVPRRSFGARALMLGGFPRDTPDPKVKGGIDTLIFVLQGTFETYPGAFKGPIVPFVRQVMSKPAILKKESETYLKNIAAKDLEAKFEEARDRYNSAPPTENTLKTTTLPLMTLEKTAYAPSETLVQKPSVGMCESAKPTTVLEPNRGPNVRQTPGKLWDSILPSKDAISVAIQGNSEVALRKMSDKDISTNLKLKFPSLKLPTLQKFVNESNDGIALMTVLHRLMDILNPPGNIELRQALVLLDTTIDPSLLRDTVRGLIFKFLHSVSKDPNTELKLQFALRRDVVLRMVLLRREEAEKVQNSLRAKERETFKQRMRQMPDQEREVTKQLLDIGLAGYIITNEDRRIFAKEQEIVDQDEETLRGIRDMDENMPEDGHNANRDVEDGQAPFGENGRELETDYGDYGDRADRDTGDYGEDRRYDFGEGDGV